MILQMQDNNTVSVMHSTIDTKKTFCARQFTELCELLWKRIRILVELQCAGCDIESSEHSHTFQNCIVIITLQKMDIFSIFTKNTLTLFSVPSQEV